MDKIKIELGVNEAEWLCSWLMPWLSRLPEDKRQKYKTCQQLYNKIRLQLDILYPPPEPDYDPDHF